MDKQYCIFDMDGTLTDSMHYWKDLGSDYLHSKGISPDERLLWMVQAMTMTQAAQHFMDSFGLPGPPEQIIAEMHAIMEAHYREDVPLKPGVQDYLKQQKTRGARLCVATATANYLSEACLTRLGVLDQFDFVLSCEMVGVSKERPDLYLLAAQRLGALPQETAVFEDALFAARTAKNAGFYTVGVYDSSYADSWPELQALAHETITDWREAL